MAYGVTFKNRNNARITFTIAESKLEIALTTGDGYANITLGSDEVTELRELLNGERGQS